MTSQIEPYSLEELQEIRNNWRLELDNSTTGQTTSLIFAKHTVIPAQPSSEKGLVIVVGGSHLIVAQIARQNGIVEILTYDKSSLPVLEAKEILFSLLEKQIPKDISKIALNFAYPLQPAQRSGLIPTGAPRSGDSLDGLLLAPSKEHQFGGLIGQNVGQELEKYLEARFSRKFQVAVANDTVCLVLAGLSQSSPDNLAGGIVGTGFNFGLFLDRQTLVNLEAANFNKFPQSTTGKIITQESQEPDKGWYEKEVSGAYLYKHYNLLAKEQKLKEVSSTVELNTLAAGAQPEGKLAQALFARSASLVAAQIAGVYDFKKQNQLNLVMEGSLFWRGWNYKNLVYKHLQAMDLTLNHLQVFKIERSYLLGAAELIL